MIEVCIQIGEIPPEPKTELEIVLSVFEQRFLDEDKSWLKQYEYVITNELLQMPLRAYPNTLDASKICSRRFILPHVFSLSNQLSTVSRFPTT